MEPTIEELQAKLAEAEQAKAALTGELTDTRPKLREKDDLINTLKEQLKAATDKNNENPEEEKIRKAVEAQLAKDRATTAEANRKKAFEKFVAGNKDYHPDNDQGGLKKAALEKELANLNTWNTLTETEDLIAVIGKANTYLRGVDTSRQNDTTVAPYSSTTNSPAAPVGDDKDGLSPSEKKLIERNGWTKEKYTALKAKMPDYVENLVAGVK